MANELILIVEDDDNSRKLLRDSLQVTGYETAEASNGELGLELARQRRPALILMDIQLPGISGFDALRSLRSDPDTRTIPVIAVTASVMSTQQNDVLQAGFDALESKPVSIVGLLRKMRALLDRKAAPPVAA
jgi:two-component system, cell cycle response regulator DivK